MEITETAQKVLEKRYFINGERTWEELSHRVSSFFAKDKREEYLFDNMLISMDALPNSPTLMNAGTDLSSFSACFVLLVEDNIESIFKYYGDAGLIGKSGGGVGANFSKLRPESSSVGTTGGVASGPISFMKGQDALTDIIKQGGRRRGANMGILNVDHPDILPFIKAKEEPGVLENFNLSVRVSDEFMKNKDEEVWDAIVSSAWKSGEPGLLFGDRIEEGNEVPHLGKLVGVNPCVGPMETLLTKEYGHVPIIDVVGEEVSVWNGSEWSKCTPKETGRNKEMLTVSISSGPSLKCTLNHKFILHDGSRVEAKDLKVGYKLDKCELPIINCGDDYSRKEMYTRGFFCGDGSTCKGGKQNIWLYDIKRKLANSLIHSSISHYEGRDLLSYRNYKGYNKSFVPTIEWSIKSRLDYLAGLLDSDGCLNSKCGAVAISSVDRVFLRGIQDMLQTLGADSSIHLMKEEGHKYLPDGKGGLKKYHCQDCYRISISATNVKRLRNLGLTTERVDISIANPNRDASRYKVISAISEASVEERVYCVTEPKNHSVMFSSMITGNCGEQPLLPYESCSLISINLSNVVEKGIYGPEVDWDKLAEITEVAVLFMNRVLDKSIFPIPECQDAMSMTRKIGVGIMGLHDMLIQLELEYDSQSGRDIAASVMSFIADVADGTSTRLGEEEGVYNGWVKGCPQRRNAHLTTIAPTGTVSMIADCSSGCEPYYSSTTIKKVLDGSSFVMTNKWGDFKGAQDIHWRDHILMQAALQEQVDSGISKTINMASDATKEEVKEAYEFAWKEGCKGITVYRDGCRGVQVLSRVTEDQGASGGMSDGRGGELGDGDSSPSVEDDGEIPVPWKLEIPEEIEARRYRVVDNEGEKVYITVGHMDEEPVEIFVQHPYERTNSYLSAISRLISLSLRFSIPLKEVCKQLQKSSTSVADIPAKLARILDSYQDEGSWMSEVDNPCPDCGSKLVPEGGCFNCKHCGYSKCL